MTTLTSNNEAGNQPCQVCSWTTERQLSCNYYSHVKVFYEASKQGVWSIGSRYIVKDSLTPEPNLEADNLRFLQENTQIPVPRLKAGWSEADGAKILITERIAGEPLSSLWQAMSGEERNDIAYQTAEALKDLRNLCSPHLQSLDGQPLYSSFLFPTGPATPHGTPHGPLHSDDELWKEMAKSLPNILPKGKDKAELKAKMPPATPYTFTHGDLNMGNIMVKNGKLTGILDWENSGYFPVWWEYAGASVGHGEEDREWKMLLRQYLGPRYESGRLFWLEFFNICKTPVEQEPELVKSN